MRRAGFCVTLRSRLLAPTIDRSSSLIRAVSFDSKTVNRDVDEELDGSNLEHVLAQIDVTYSNSMIEAFWRSLKHSWLYRHGLETESELRGLVAFYVEAHNDVMPHSAFDGQTPNAVFFAAGDAVVAKLAAERVQAQAERMASNRSAECGRCIGRAG